MSGVWNERTNKHTQIINITTAAALIDALKEMGCVINTNYSEIAEFESAKNNFANSIKIMSEIQPMSLEASKQYEEAVEKAIQASENLQKNIEKINNFNPSKIEIKDKNSKSRTLKKIGGAYRLEWTETYQQYSYDNKTRGHDDQGGKEFSSNLLKANDAAQVKNKQSLENARKLLGNNEELSSKFNKAMEIRQRWQAIEDNKNLQTFRQTRATTLEEKGKKLGYKARRVVDTEDEILISLRRRR